MCLQKVLRAVFLFYKIFTDLCAEVSTRWMAPRPTRSSLGYICECLKRKKYELTKSGQSCVVWELSGTAPALKLREASTTARPPTCERSPRAGDT